MEEKLMKTCTKCKVERSLDEFHKNKISKDGRKSVCKYCVKKYNKEYQEKNKEKTKKYIEENREHINKRSREYNRRWKEENKEYVRKREREYRKKRRKEDPLFKMKCTLRSRNLKAFKASLWHKDSKSIDMLGCNYEEAFKHIESQFTDGMSWSNHTTDGWHIDHIIPLASAKTEEELIKLCHYTNLQPMWAEENLSKGCRY